jgi:hypothetical protein
MGVELSAYAREEAKFKDYHEFKLHIAKIKEQKRQNELQATERELENPFQTNNFTKLGTSPSSGNTNQGLQQQAFAKRPSAIEIPTFKEELVANAVVKERAGREMAERSKTKGMLPKEKLETLEKNSQ